MKPESGSITQGFGPSIPTQHDEGMVQVMLLDSLLPAFVVWLNSRRLHLFRIPGEEPEGFATYAIGIHPDLMREASVLDRAVVDQL